MGMRPANDLTGRAFGRLKVVSRSGSDECGKSLWSCVCDCGEIAIVRGYALTRGDTQSCDCLVGLVRRSQPATLYDGLTLAEHATRSGISQSTLDKRVRKYGEPFPAHLDKTRAEQEPQSEGAQVNYDDWITSGLDEWLGEVRPLTAQEREERQREEHERCHFDD
jgi:hypothetical protein